MLRNDLPYLSLPPLTEWSSIQLESNAIRRWRGQSRRIQPILVTRPRVHSGIHRFPILPLLVDVVVGRVAYERVDVTRWEEAKVEP